LGANPSAVGDVQKSVMLARRFAVPLCLVGVLVPLAFGDGSPKIHVKPGHIKPNSNPPKYVSFSRLLDARQRPVHALSRLTFGPRPGDLRQLDAMGS
jgi:hypothetical protein